MSYIKPQDVVSPRNRLSKVKVIFDGGEGAWSLARLTWDGDDGALGIRWNGSDGAEVGNPSARNYPTWFIVPHEIAELIETSLILGNKVKIDTQK